MTLSLISLLAVVLIVGIVLWVLSTLPLPQPFRTAINIAIAIIAIWFLATHFL